jgi:hypothetical protein
MYDKNSKDVMWENCSRQDNHLVEKKILREGTKRSDDTKGIQTITMKVARDFDVDDTTKEKHPPLPPCRLP